MSIELKTEENGRILNVTLSGKLTRHDYEHFLPEVERQIRQHGKMRMLVDMHDFHGWTIGALWEDIKFDMRHYKDLERIAFVGETRWQKGMTAFCKPFTSATLRYFDRDQTADARAWLSSELAEAA